MNDLALLTEVLEERVSTSCREVLHEELQVLRDEVRIVIREELSGPISPRGGGAGDDLALPRSRLRASSIAAMRRSVTGHSLQSEKLETSSPLCASPTPQTPKTPKTPAQNWGCLKPFGANSPPDLPNSLRALGDEEEIVRAPEDLPAPKTPKVAAPTLPIDDALTAWPGRISQMSDTTNDDALCKSHESQSSAAWAASVPEQSRGARSSLRSSMMARIDMPLTMPTWHELLHKAVASPHFDSVFGFCVILNAGIMGIQVDWMARNSSDEAPVVFDVFEKTFACIFLFELFCRFIAHGRRFFSKDVWFWHAFDTFLVGVQVFEEVAVMAVDAAMTQQNNFSWLRVVRFLRLVRVIRTVRILRLVGELRTLVLSILGSLRALVWAVVLLFLLMYIIGIFITQLVLDYRLEKSADLLAAQPDLEETHMRILHYYGSLGDTILSIYKAVTGGVDWGDIVDPLDTLISVYMVPFFMLYVAFSLLCMLNVITGVFVESALQSTKKDTSLYLFGRLKNLFTQHDLDGDGRISMHEFLIAAQTEEIQAVFTQLDLNISDADVVFQALDKFEVGLLSADEFIQGCQELSGAAKSLDLLVMKRESAKQVQRVDERTVKLENMVQMINRKVDALGVTLTNAKMAQLRSGGQTDQHQLQLSPTSPSTKQLISGAPSPPHSPPHFLTTSPAPNHHQQHHHHTQQQPQQHRSGMGTGGAALASPETCANSPSTASPSPSPSPRPSPAAAAAAAAARARTTRLVQQYQSTSSNSNITSNNSNSNNNALTSPSVGAHIIGYPGVDDDVDDDDEVVLLGGGLIPQEEV